MKLPRHRLASGVFLIVLAAAASALAQEQKISCDVVPMAVRAAFKKEFPKATIKSCAKEVEKDKTAYEIESIEGKTHRDVLFYADGTLIVVEETIAVGDLPDPVQQAARKRYPGGAITLAEKVTRDGAVLYELRVKHQDRLEEIVFDASANEVKR